MEIIYYHPFFDEQQWIDGIAKRIPGANLRVWKEGDTGPADYAFVWKPPYDMLKGRKDLKAIFVLGAGVDAILDQERQNPGMLPEGIPIYRIEDAGMAIQMEEYSLAAALRYFRRFDKFAEQQAVKQWGYLPPYTHDNFVVGVMGLGQLGAKVAERFASFGFTVKGYSNSKKTIKGVESYSKDELHAFLKGTKLIVNLLPSTKDTVDILNKETLGLLEKGAFLVNIARGVHVVDADLIAALDSGQLDGATLDVFRQEPLPESHPFWSHPKITLTPHLSAIAHPEIIMDNVSGRLLQLAQGKSVPGAVDRKKGY